MSLIEEYKKQRKRFTKTVSQYTVTDHNELRTQSDSLLILADQLEAENERLTKRLEKLKKLTYTAQEVKEWLESEGYIGLAERF